MVSILHDITIDVLVLTNTLLKKPAANKLEKFIAEKVQEKVKQMQLDL